MALTRREIDEQNEFQLFRRKQYRRAAECVAAAFAEEPAVARVALIGSVAKPPFKEVPRFREYRQARVEVWNECGDVDLAVWVDGLDRDPDLLGRLRKAIVGTLKDLFRDEQIGVASHQVEVFLIEPTTDEHVGRLCAYNRCPKGKPACSVPGCGAVPFLRQFADFRFFDDALDGAVVLFDRTILT